MRNLGRQNIILVQVFLFVCRYLSLLPRRSNIDLRLRMAIALSKKSLQSCIELHNWCLLLWMFFCQQFVWIMFLVSARSKFPSFPLILSLSKSFLCTRARSFTVCIFAASWLGQSTSTMKFFQRALLCFFGTEPVSFYFGLTNKWALLYKRVLIAHPWSRYLPPSTRIQLHVSFLCSFVSPNIFLVLTFNLFQFNHVMLAMREKLA